MCTDHMTLVPFVSLSALWQVAGRSYCTSAVQNFFTHVKQLSLSRDERWKGFQVSSYLPHQSGIVLQMFFSKLC